MTTIKAGDTVMITNIDGINYGWEAWKEHDITEVTHIDSDGDAWLAVTNFKSDGDYKVIEGRLSYVVLACEFEHLAKILPVNGAETKPKKAQCYLGERVRVVGHPYDLEPEQSVGTIMRRVSSFESRRGTYVVKLDDYMSLTFFPNEMEALEE